MYNKDFDFINYYKNVLQSGVERTYFMVLICKKLNRTHATFHSWIYREKLPSMAEIHIVGIIKDKKYKLPQIPK